MVAFKAVWNYFCNIPGITHCLLKRFLKISGYIVATIFLLLLVIVALVNYSPVQSYLARQAAGVLSDKLKTKVDVAHVRIGLLNSVLIQGVYIEGQAKDTLLYAGEMEMRMTDWFIFKEKPVIHFVGLQDAYVHLYRKSSSKVWNYDFIAEAFITPKQTKSENSKAVEFDLKKVELENVRIHMDDAWIGEDMDYDLGYLLVNTEGIDFKKKLIDVKKIEVRDTRIYVNEYKGGRPKHLRPKYLDTFDVTPFNPDMWVLKVKNVSMEGSAFHLKMDDNVPVAGHFDESHIDVKNIHIEADDIVIVGDTLRGHLQQVSGEDRSGLMIKQMHAKVTISPIASVCEDLYMETNHSIIKDYYAMHYRHFPDFNHYIDSVTMVARLRESVIDKRDITFFAPELADFPEMQLTVSGNARGTVPDLVARKMNISDGNISLRGDLSMKGLPDIYTTHIAFTDGEILTTGKGILHYAPELKAQPYFAADSISYAYFLGAFDGYIEKFNVKGTFKSNLGIMSTDMNMTMRGFKSDSAEYDGTISTNRLQLGKLLRLPILGDITMDEKISGRSFNAHSLQMGVDGFIKELGINGYVYHNITTHGTLAKKEFDGKLKVDDPNLGLDFNGHLDYAGKLMKINAKAHLAKSDFRALKITSENITAAADFDLDWTGSNIDDFSGYARLSNMNLQRNGNRMGIDSVYARSTTGDTGSRRRLDISSDAFIASIQGKYKLTDLPASVQYYLSRYLPSYIKAPEKYAPDQDLTFAITTMEVDSFFAAAFPIIRGFDSSVITGSLNTSNKKLTLNATVPFGNVGLVYLNNLSVIGEGDFSSLALNTTADNIAIGDSILYGSLSLTTTVGNDSVSFTLATTAPNKESSLSLNGQVVAQNDTLRLSLTPSQFYMKKSRWDIATGSSVVYSGKYLYVHNLAITSGIQRMSAEGTGQSVVIKTENIDIAQMSNWADLSGYQADGRVNGTVHADSIFSNLLISVNMKATGVKLGGDSIGTVNIVGSYDAKKQLITIDPQTGVFRDNASVVASGNISFDSAAKRKMEGAIRFNNARVAWASPFLVGLMSNLSGNVNGDVIIRGSSDKPIVDGKLTLTNAGVKLDYMGCYYTIPAATVNFDNKRIDLGRVQLYDSYKNSAILSGYFTHDLFDKMRMRMKITSQKIEVMNLSRKDNDLFYGKLFASMDSFTIRGAFNNVRLNMYNGAPAAKSTIFIPVSTGGYTGGYSYVSFKTFGTEQEKAVRKSKDKISINIDANMNPLCQVRIVLDPTTEDEIVATGSGNISMEIPPNNDMRMNGIYTIKEGTYTLTFQQVAIHKVFKLNSGSTISFNGPFEETNLAVHAVYPVRARLYDLLTENEKTSIAGTREAIESQTPQWVNVVLHMNGPIYNSKLTFDIGLENDRSQSTFAHTKLMRINSDDQQKFDQVASLLLANQFIPPEGGGGSAVAGGAKNNVSQMLSNTASKGLTNLINKKFKSRNLNVDFRYNNYNYNDQGAIGNVNRNQLKLGLTKNYLNERLQVSVGSTSDWGRQAATNTATNFNLAGDFRLQYLLSEQSGLRLNAFHTSDYDITRNQNIQRTGAGIGWGKSFDNLGDFFGGAKRKEKKKQKQQKLNPPATDTVQKVSAE